MSERGQVFRDLLGGLEIAPKESTIALSLIDPWPDQPRRYFDPERYAALRRSIAQQGILQPVLLRPQGERYQLIAGARRVRAARELGLATVPALVRELNDIQARELALVENLQREGLNPLEETWGTLDLLALKLGLDRAGAVQALDRMLNHSAGESGPEAEIIQAVFQDLGKLTPQSFRTHRLPLLNLPAEILQALEQGQLHYTKARALAQIPDPVFRDQLLQQAISENLSLAQIRSQIQQTRAPDDWQKRCQRVATALKSAPDSPDLAAKLAELEALLRL